MKCFIAVSYQNRISLKPVISQIKTAVNKKGYEPEVFVEYEQNGMTNKEMMETALDRVKNAQLLIAEISTKAVGVGIEMGVAYASKIPIIGIRKKGSENSDTMEGILALPVIEYEDINLLSKQLEKSIEKI